MPKAERIAELRGKREGHAGHYGVTFAGALSRSRRRTAVAVEFETGRQLVGGFDAKCAILSHFATAGITVLHLDPSADQAALGMQRGEAAEQQLFVAKSEIQLGEPAIRTARLLAAGARFLRQAGLDERQEFKLHPVARCRLAHLSGRAQVFLATISSTFPRTSGITIWQPPGLADLALATVTVDPADQSAGRRKCGWTVIGFGNAGLGRMAAPEGAVFRTRAWTPGHLLQRNTTRRDGREDKGEAEDLSVEHFCYHLIRSRIDVSVGKITSGSSFSRSGHSVQTRKEVSATAPAAYIPTATRL